MRGLLLPPPSPPPHQRPQPHLHVRRTPNLSRPVSKYGSMPGKHAPSLGQLPTLTSTRRDDGAGQCPCTTLDAILSAGSTTANHGPHSGEREGSGLLGLAARTGGDTNQRAFRGPSTTKANHLWGGVPVEAGLPIAGQSPKSFKAAFDQEGQESPRRGSLRPELLA